MLACSSSFQLDNGDKRHQYIWVPLQIHKQSLENEKDRNS